MYLLLTTFRTFLHGGENKRQFVIMIQLRTRDLMNINDRFWMNERICETT